MDQSPLEVGGRVKYRDTPIDGIIWNSEYAGKTGVYRGMSPIFFDHCLVEWDEGHFPDIPFVQNIVRDELQYSPDQQGDTDDDI
jgi:hypothetical protein